MSESFSLHSQHSVKQENQCHNSARLKSPNLESLPRSQSQHHKRSKSNACKDVQSGLMSKSTQQGSIFTLNPSPASVIPSQSRGAYNEPNALGVSHSLSVPELSDLSGAFSIPLSLPSFNSSRLSFSADTNTLSGHSSDDCGNSVMHAGENETDKLSFASLSSLTMPPPPSNTYATQRSARQQRCLQQRRLTPESNVACVINTRCSDTQVAHTSRKHAKHPATNTAESKAIAAALALAKLEADAQAVAKAKADAEAKARADAEARARAKVAAAALGAAIRAAAAVRTAATAAVAAEISGLQASLAAPRLRRETRRAQSLLMRFAGGCAGALALFAGCMRAWGRGPVLGPLRCEAGHRAAVAVKLAKAGEDGGLVELLQSGFKVKTDSNCQQSDIDHEDDASGVVVDHDVFVDWINGSATQTLVNGAAQQLHSSQVAKYEEQQRQLESHARSTAAGRLLRRRKQQQQNHHIQQAAAISNATRIGRLF